MFREVLEKGNRGLIIFWGLVLIVEVVLEVVVTVLLPQFSGLTTAALVSKNASTFYPLLMIMGLLYAGFATCQGAKRAIVGSLSAQVRVGLSKLLMKTWAQRSLDTAVDNPDGRIADDTRVCTDRFFEIFTEVVISLLIVTGLVVSMSAQPLLLLVSFVYISLSLSIAYLFKKPLVESRTVSQVKEQDFRTSLIKVSLGKGDKTFKSRLEAVRSSYLRYIRVKALYRLFFEYKSGAVALLPAIVLFPLYSAGSITVATYFASVASFNLIVINATITMNYYTDITDANASWKRVKEFLNEKK